MDSLTIRSKAVVKCCRKAIPEQTAIAFLSKTDPIPKLGTNGYRMR